MKTKPQILISILFAWICLSGGEINAQTVYAVSADKMNVLYIGVDNPLTIAVAGIPATQISASISNGTLLGEKGKYIARVKGPADVAGVVKIFSVSDKGAKDSVGSVSFRVKNVPNPVPVFMGKRGTDVIKLAQLKVAVGVIAQLDNFEFDLKFPVVSFCVSMTVETPEGGGQDIEECVEGPVLSVKQKELLNKANVGSKIYIEKVKVKKPNGDAVDIGSIILKVI